MASTPRRAFAVPDHWRQWLASPGMLAGGAVALGLIGGVVGARVGAVLPLALVVGLVVAAAALRDARAGVYAAIAVVCLLPYATLPLKVGLTFTLLEAVTLLAWAVVALRLAYDRSEIVIVSPVFVPLGIFLAETTLAFLIGAGRNTTTQTAHDYGKLLLGVGMIALVVQVVRARQDVARLATSLVAGGGVAALIALALDKLPGATTTNLLARLRVVGYPTDRLVRYVEDNPALARRATGTGVDPNSFAAFLMVVLVLAVGQAVARRPLVPRGLCIAVVPLAGLAMLLTQSRQTLLGAGTGVAVLAVVRYRRLIAPVALLGVVVAVFGVGSSFAARFLAGVHGQDAATQLRYREFGNALTLIRQYPVFGVGFGDAPRIDLQTGVSSMYLTIAERTGLVGLALFLVALGVLLVRLLRGGARAPADDAGGELLLAIGAALVAACVAATLDHYFFNLGFPHMAALFWVLAGLGEVLVQGFAPSQTPHAMPLASSSTIAGGGR